MGSAQPEASDVPDPAGDRAEGPVVSRAVVSVGVMLAFVLWFTALFDGDWLVVAYTSGVLVVLGLAYRALT